MRLAALAFALLLAACGPATIRTDVVRFHDLPPTGRGKTFFIQPDPVQRGSLEFESYARRVAAKLTAHAYQPIHDYQRAELVVLVRYGVDGGRSEVRTTPVWGVTGYDPYGFPYAYPYPYAYYGGAYPYRSRYEVVGTQVDSYTIFTRWLELDILDGPDYRRGLTRKVFEGRAHSEGLSRLLPPIMPYLVEALFDRFPGVSGQTTTVNAPYLISPGD